MQSCPKELLAYDRAYAEEIKEKDKLIHMWIGNYGLSALVYAIDHCLQGNKASTKYISSPILSKKPEGEENEVLAVYEMKKRQKMIEKMGLPESPR